MVRSHRTICDLKTICDLWNLTEYGAKQILNGDNWKPSYDRDRPPRDKGMRYDQPTQKQAVGFRYGSHVKLVCAIDPETFDQIREIAVKKERSVAEIVRRLIEFGLETELKN